MKRIFTFLLAIFIGQQVVVGQCDPPAALTCSAAPLLCALDMLDGFSCTTLSTSNPTGPNPLCGGVGTPSNTQWWAFKGNGKGMTLSFNVDLAICSQNKGIEAGIVWSCGRSSLVCNTDCNTSSFDLSFSSERCYTYYLWVDGCDGDICDFDIQITNGEPRHLPDPLVLTRYPHHRKPCTHSTYCVKIEGICDVENFQWSLDGVDLPSVGDKFCYTFSNPQPGTSKEVCVELTVGEGGTICDQGTQCAIFLPNPKAYIDDGEFGVCWEDHRDNGFQWRDTIIYASCIDPPCKINRRDSDGCYFEYTSEINIKEQRYTQIVHKFICDKSQLPYITEDGSVWLNEVCGEGISWKDMSSSNCDTSYILNLEVFDPNVEFLRSCASCNDSITLYSDIIETNVCKYGVSRYVGIWLNDMLDTLGYGDSLITEYRGNIFFHIFIENINSTTGHKETCTIHDTSWHINIKNEPLTILGDISICQVDTSEYSLPESYTHGCKIEWTLEDVTGNIISSAPNKMSTIKVHWPTHNTVDGKICAEIIDNCDSVRKVCFDLEGCVTTNSQNTSQDQWSVFPNPARDVIYIHGNNITKTKSEIHDLEGNAIAVQPKQDISGAISIDVSEMASGIYLIQLSDGKKKEVIRFVKL